MQSKHFRLAAAVALASLLATLFLAAASPAGSRPSWRTAAIDRALLNVRAHAALAHLGSGDSFAVRGVIRDRSGAAHVRLDRRYEGMEVLGGDLVVHNGPTGSLRRISQTLGRSIAVSTSPRVSRARAVQIARERFVGTATSARAHLIVDALGKPALAWEVVIRGIRPDTSPSELHVVVGATRGAVRLSWDGIEHASGTGNGFFDGVVGLQTTPISGGYRLTDPTRGNGLTCDMKNRTNACYYMDDADNLWGDGTLSNRQSIAVDAQYGTAETWDYYKAVHGRNGIGNDGKGAANRVHYSKRYNNAFWSDSCFCMTYGDGDGVTYNPFDSLDVAGHEMSHGVTSRTAGLIYSGESGGLNEANSDIFGTMVEYYAANSKDTPDYKIGEKLYRNNPGETKALRYMWQPSLDGASADCWRSGVGSLDVHYSSGVGNHFYFLLAEGSSGPPASPTCNGSTVAGVGRGAAERIWYRALTVYMTSGTDYHGARAASLSAAADLFGAGSAQYNAVNAAWAAVNVA